MATFQHDDTQPCIDTYANWQGKPIDPSDQWQCPSGVSSFSKNAQSRRTMTTATLLSPFICAAIATLPLFMLPFEHVENVVRPYSQDGWDCH